MTETVTPESVMDTGTQPPDMDTGTIFRRGHEFVMDEDGAEVPFDLAFQRRIAGFEAGDDLAVNYAGDPDLQKEMYREELAEAARLKAEAARLKQEAANAAAREAARLARLAEHGSVVAQIGADATACAMASVQLDEPMSIYSD